MTDIDMDDLCNSFALANNCEETPPDEYEFMEEMLETLKYNFRPNYLEICAKAVTRYNHVFLTEIHNSSKDFNYTTEIKIMADRFSKNWTWFAKNRHNSSSEDTIFMRNSLIELFSTLKLSIDERHAKDNSQPVEDVSDDEEIYSDHENMSD